MVEFHLLGPVEVTSNGRPVVVGGARTRAVLGLLLANANTVVSADRLADELWPGLAPERGAANLQVRLSELRKALRSVGEADRLLTRPPGYLLRVMPEELDVIRFEQLAAAGREAIAAGDPAHAVALLDQALMLWRGPALADLDQLPFASAERARLDELRLGALESRIDARIACGRHNETIAELEALTGEYPLRERFAYQRLIALYRAGRQADALRAYRELRSRMVEQLGIEPSPSCASSKRGSCATTQDSITSRLAAAPSVPTLGPRHATYRAAASTSPTRFSVRASATSCSYRD